MAAGTVTRVVRIVVDGSGARDGANVVKRSLDDVDRSADSASRSADRLNSTLSALKSALVAVGVAGLVRELVQLADAWASVSGRLSLVTSSTAELKSVQEALYRTAQQTRSGLEETVDLFTRLSRATRDVKVTQGELLDVTKSVAQALRISNASTQEAAAAMTQLGQALGSGKLAGDEFRSLSENAPRLMEALAAGLNKPIGALKKLATEGKLTAQVVIDALKSQAKVIDEEFGRIPLTVEQSLVVARNALIKFVGDADQAGGASKALAAAITTIATAIESPAIKQGAAQFAATLATGIAGGFQAVSAAAAFVRANLDEILAVLTLIASAKTVTVLSAITAGLWGMVAAAAAFAATPVGAIATALGLAAAAVVYFRDEVLAFGGQTASVWSYAVTGVRGIGSMLSAVGQEAAAVAGDIHDFFRNNFGNVLTEARAWANAIIGIFVGAASAAYTAWREAFTSLFAPDGWVAARALRMGAAIQMAIAGNTAGALEQLTQAITGPDRFREIAAKASEAYSNAMSTDFVGAAGEVLVKTAEATVGLAADMGKRWGDAARQEFLAQWGRLAEQMTAADRDPNSFVIPKPTIKKPSPVVDDDKKAGKGIESYYQQQTAALTKQLETFLQLDDAAENFYETVKRGGKGLTQQQASELAALQNTVNAFKSLDKAGKSLQSAMDGIKKDTYSGAADSLVKLIKAQEAAPAAISRAREELAKAKLGTEQYEAAQRKLTEETDRYAGSGESYRQGLENLNEELGKGVDALRENVAEFQNKARVLALEIDGSDSARQALEALTRQRALDLVQQEREKTLGPLRRQLQQAEADGYEDIAAALRKTIAEYEGLYAAKATADVEIVDRERLKADAEEAREAFQEPFREAARSIQSTLADTFEQIFSGGIKSFKDLGRSILDIFIKLAAQIAALLVFRPVDGAEGSMGIVAGLDPDDFAELEAAA